MVCSKCGRRLRNDALYCKGCGTQQIHVHVKADSASDICGMPVNSNAKAMKTGKALLLSLLFVALSLGVYFLYPIVSEKFTPEDSGYQGIFAEDQSAKKIDRVEGDILTLTANISDCVVTGEEAYDNGSWQKDFLVNGSIVVKTLRRPTNDAWINTHIFEIYPDVATVSQVGEASSSDVAVRIRFTSEKAPGCTIDAVCIPSGAYDHLFIVEMPDEYTEEYEAWLNEWVDSLEIVDVAEAAGAAYEANPADSASALAA